MAANHGEEKTSNALSRSRVGAVPGFRSIQAFTASGSLGRCGSTLPGMAARASRSSRISAVRMLVSWRQPQRSQPTAPSRGPEARTRREEPQSAVSASCSSGVASPRRSAADQCRRG